MKIEGYIKIQEQLHKIQLKLEIYNVAHDFYIIKDNDDSIFDEEIRNYLGADYTKIF